MTIADETSAILVLSGGGLDWDPDLIGAAAGIESEMREAEFEALETVLTYSDDDRLIAPSDSRSRLELARAIVTLGWGWKGET